MKVSVITVCFNCEASIAEALESVAAQSHANLEHIVIDGASKDDTVKIVRDRGKRVAQLVSEPDGGIYDAMNKGLRLATGDLVGFLNADDIFAHSGVVASIVLAAQQNPLADAVYGDLVYVRQDKPDQTLRHWRSGQFTRERLRFGWMPPHPTFYIRTQLLHDVGRFDDTLRISADYDFMLRCLSKHGTQAVYIPDVLVRMRTGGASNRTLSAIIRKSREDLHTLRANHIGGWFSLMCKNLRKLPQFL